MSLVLLCILIESINIIILLDPQATWNIASVGRTCWTLNKSVNVYFSTRKFLSSLCNKSTVDLITNYIHSIDEHVCISIHYLFLFSSNYFLKLLWWFLCIIVFNLSFGFLHFQEEPTFILVTIYRRYVTTHFSFSYFTRKNTNSKNKFYIDELYIILKWSIPT